MIEFSSDDNKEAMIKAFELFGLCMAAGPCNNCVFFDRRLPEDRCNIGCPNTWHLFSVSTENGYKNRKVVLKIINENAIREIEKELGYKIKIVDKKEDEN